MEEEKKQNVSTPVNEPTDLAGKSLADALRLSFRLLSFFMIAVLALFLLTGLSTIHDGECGIRLLFGKVQGEGISSVLKEGLAWSFPEPVGRVEKISTGERQLKIDDFWPYETPEDDLKLLSERRAPQEGIRPGWDGALLTGDRALVHVKLICYYRVGFRDNEPNAEAVVDYASNVIDADELVQSVVCNAAIRVASTLTVDLILTAGKVGGEDDGKQADDEENEFGEAIRKIGQQRLDAMGSGIWLSSVETTPRIPPLAAMAAFNAVNTASNEKDKMIQAAVGEANTILQSTIGEVWKELVEDPTARSDRTSKKPLLKRYAEARDRDDDAQADKLLKKINYLLVSNKTEGEASGIIEDAKRYKNSVVGRVEASAKKFNELLPQFNASPRLMVTRKWADVKEKILGSKTMPKYYIPAGQKFILRIGMDPDTAIRRAAERLKIQQEQQRENKPGR